MAKCIDINTFVHLGSVVPRIVGGVAVDGRKEV